MYLGLSTQAIGPRTQLSLNQAFSPCLNYVVGVTALSSAVHFSLQFSPLCSDASDYTLMDALILSHHLDPARSLLRSSPSLALAWHKEGFIESEQPCGKCSLSSWKYL